MSRAGALALTEELVARTRCAIEEDPLPEDLLPCTDEDHAAEIAAILAGRPPDRPVWLFAYGSLLWNPAFEHREERQAVAHGWHRSFCMHIDSHRGTREQPGLMMALDRGGRCRGIAYRLPEESLERELDRLVRRELPVKRRDGIALHRPRWMGLETDAGPLRALGFVINRHGPHYAGGLGLAETADILARACGAAGSCAEYLYNTVVQLEAHRIRDRNLWRLQSLVAERLARQAPRESDPARGERLILARSAGCPDGLDARSDASG